MSQNTSIQYPSLSVFKRILSYLAPVPVRQASGTFTPLLELYRYRGRWQLATGDALYSDGNHYAPIVIAAKKLKRQLPAVKNVLLLGTGLGSAVSVLARRKVFPAFTLVEIDEVVLQWALQLLQPVRSGTLTPVCTDAQQFIEEDHGQYDLLIVDIFAGRHVPSFVSTQAFIDKCRQRISTGGHFVMNYIVNDPAHWQEFQLVLLQVLPTHQIVASGLNRIIIATV